MKRSISHARRLIMSRYEIVVTPLPKIRSNVIVKLARAVLRGIHATTDIIFYIFTINVSKVIVTSRGIH